ncbi:MAG: hypothetical protein LH645_02260 [Actinomycetia bacterium]|nr:hypothetical protein [Actinomycetes bacterium]
MRPPPVASLLASVSLSAFLAVSVAPAASAAELPTTDPSGDNAGPGLDIVGASVDNGADALVATMSFRKVRSGAAIVGIKAKGLGLVRLASKRHDDGTSRDFLLNAAGRITCDGFVATWGETSSSLTFTVPSTCLWGNDYSTVRAPWILTEVLKGADVDGRPSAAKSAYGSGHDTNPSYLRCPVRLLYLRPYAQPRAGSLGR